MYVDILFRDFPTKFAAVKGVFAFRESGYTAGSLQGPAAPRWGRRGYKAGGDTHPSHRPPLSPVPVFASDSSTKQRTKMRGVYIAAVVMLVAVLAVTQATSVLPPPSKDCKYWCKDNKNQNYCCGLPHEVFPPFTSEHPGRCPPVRSSCTGVRIAGPKYCPHDGVCAFTSKCCFDVCLKRHVCKTAEQKYGR
ncbi:uncharacterized protein LOC127009495 [Eriocheir sinensis]|uniref:uncharacterized protein LOC127009495 n=1 Tax=Eriocheir sinensis TaxID=95602 RepID=UPI0021C78F73|nr:uncharacterized protein LOC127009495 [Eriocheir sinensis]